MDICLELKVSVLLCKGPTGCHLVKQLLLQQQQPLAVRPKS